MTTECPRCSGQAENRPLLTYTEREVTTNTNWEPIICPRCGTFAWDISTRPEQTTIPLGIFALTHEERERLSAALLGRPASAPVLRLTPEAIEKLLAED